MGHFYPPPPPFIGGCQPLAPRKLTPPSVTTPSDNPPFGLPGTSTNLNSVLGTWAASTVPQRLRYLPQVAQVDNPPFGLRIPQIGAADWVMPPRPVQLTPPSVDNPPFGLRRTQQGGSDWTLPQRGSWLVPSTPASTDNPPFGTHAQPYQSWITETRLPPRSPALVQPGVAPTADAPPPLNRGWLAPVLASSQPGPGLPWHGNWIVQSGNWLYGSNLIISTESAYGDGVTYSGGFLLGDEESGGLA